jgi:homocitrate synthase
LNNPATYEILKPEVFGMTRYVSIGHRLTGWNAVKNRAEQLGLALSDDDLKAITGKIKKLADIKNQSMEDVDGLLRNFHAYKIAGDHSAIEQLLVLPDDVPVAATEVVAA